MDNVVLCDDSKIGESGRKSASADDEETGEAIKVKKFHKNGAMFEEARRMLSSSLKKVYRYMDYHVLIRFWKDSITFWLEYFVVIFIQFFFFHFHLFPD